MTPLRIGDRITTRDWVRLDLKHGGPPGMAVVWVVDESGPEGAVPFGAWFRWEWNGTRHIVYLGHLRVMSRNPLDDGDIPPSLRGIVDPRRHYRDGLVDGLGVRIDPRLVDWDEADELRKRYYGPDRMTW